MNYFRTLPEELVYVIFSYSLPEDIEIVSKIFKLYVNYEELFIIKYPVSYKIFKTEAYKYYEPPNFYLIYKASLEINTIDYDLLNKYSNVHGLNYVSLFSIHERSPKLFLLLDKFPKHVLMYPIILFLEHIKDSSPNIIYNIYLKFLMNPIDEEFEGLDVLKAFKSVPYLHMEPVDYYIKLLRDELIKKLESK